MDIEQIRANTEEIKSKGLDSKIINLARKTYQDALRKLSGYNEMKTHVYDESLISETLSIFGGSMEGLKVIDLGCGTFPFGRGEYAPVLSTAFASLGADVTGVDLSNDYGELREKVFERYGFQYRKHNFALWEFQSLNEDGVERFSNNDLIIMHSLLHNGLMIDDVSYGIYYNLGEEWSQYERIHSKIKKLSSKDSISILQIPFPKLFPYETQRIKEEKELNDYVVNRFKSSFGDPLFGKEIPGNHVFVKS